MSRMSELDIDMQQFEVDFGRQFPKQKKGTAFHIRNGKQVIIHTGKPERIRKVYKQINMPVVGIKL